MEEDNSNSMNKDRHVKDDVIHSYGIVNNKINCFNDQQPKHGNKRGLGLCEQKTNVLNIRQKNQYPETCYSTDEKNVMSKKNLFGETIASNKSASLHSERENNLWCKVDNKNIDKTTVEDAANPDIIDTGKRYGTTNREKSDSKGKQFEMLQYVNKSDLAEVLPHGQALLLRHVNPYFILMLHKAFVLEELKEICQTHMLRIARSINSVGKSEAFVTDALPKLTMIKSSGKTTVPDASPWLCCALDDTINDQPDDEAQYLDQTMKSSLISFADFVLALLRKKFDDMPQSDDSVCMFGLSETQQAQHQPFNTVCKATSNLAKELWLNNDLKGKSWQVGYSIFMPLWFEGMALKLLHHNGNDASPDPTEYSAMSETLYRINFGSMLLVRNDVVHGGDYGSNGNLRLCGTILPSARYIKKHDVYSDPVSYQPTKLDMVKAEEVLYTAQNILQKQQYHQYGNDFVDLITVHDKHYQEAKKRYVGKAMNKAFGGWKSYRPKRKNKLSKHT